MKAESACPRTSAAVGYHRPYRRNAENEATALPEQAPQVLDQCGDMMRLILGGGGGAADSRPTDRRFAEWIGLGRLLYLPVALPEGHPLLAGCEKWIRSVFVPLGIAEIETWHASDLAGRGSDRLADRLSSFAAVYIGGGNTYRLLHLLRQSRLDRALSAYAQGGGPISGGSAGAIILGRDIGIATLAGDANTVGLTDTSGLGLLPDYDILPHYEPAMDPVVAAHAQRTGVPVIALPERGGLVIDGDQQFDSGYESSRTFLPH